MYKSSLQHRKKKLKAVEHGIGLALWRGATRPTVSQPVKAFICGRTSSSIGFKISSWRELTDLKQLCTLVYVCVSVCVWCVGGVCVCVCGVCVCVCVCVCVGGSMTYTYVIYNYAFINFLAPLPGRLLLYFAMR